MIFDGARRHRFAEPAAERGLSGGLTVPGDASHMGHPKTGG
jgi:hypothetical protein